MIIYDYIALISLFEFQTKKAITFYHIGKQNATILAFPYNLTACLGKKSKFYLHFSPLTVKI